MSITLEGFNPGGNVGSVIPKNEFKYDKRYNLALVFPYTGTSNYGETMFIYINGEKIVDLDYSSDSKGRYVKGSVTFR